MALSSSLLKLLIIMVSPFESNSFYEDSLLLVSELDTLPTELSLS